MVSKETFEVQGAGHLHIGASPNAWCGSAVGFTVSASWGQNGLAGGVMDRDEAKRLADMIYAALGSQMKPRSEVMREESA
jgi:hypothetical protein